MLSMQNIKNGLLVCCLLLFAFNAISQNSIKGKIRDAESGQTLIGATVIIKGTTQGTTTDMDGNFEIKTNATPPLTLVVSYIGFTPYEYLLKSFDEKINVKLKPENVTLEGVEISDTRISDKQKQAALTVESMDVIAIKEAPTGNFYEGLSNLKGVDMTSASLGFKVINTRGFNSTSPVRSLQLIDGVDNQSPGLNFSLGNFLGASDLDVMKVDLIAGASSAFYGPNAFNGVINMTSKSPFLFPGLSASVKVGERSLNEYAVRWAHVIKNKKGEDKFAYKLNIFHLKAYDWVADNYAPTPDSKNPEGDIRGWDAVNRYGDESFTGGSDFTDLAGIRDYPGLGRFYRTGYNEVDLVDYNTRNTKLGASVHYKIKPKIELIAASNYGHGTTVYQGDNRYSLKNIQFYQNRLEIRQEDKFFIRVYATNEDAGDSYDAVTAAFIMQNSYKSNADWNTDYARFWRTDIRGRIMGVPATPLRPNPTYPGLMHKDWGYVRNYFNKVPFGNFADTVQAILALYPDSMAKWHEMARYNADTSVIGSERPFAYPGTAYFDTVFADVTGRYLADGGARIFDRSALYHVQGEYKFAPKINDEEIAKFTIGANYRLFAPNSRGNIFSDTLSYTTELDIDGNEIRIDSVHHRIYNQEFGLYAGIEKGFFDNLLKLNFSIRMDKNQNFPYLFSPAVSAVYTASDNHVFRLSFSSAIRNPTLADQYLYYNVGRAILLGNLSGKDSLIDVDSFLDYIDSDLNRDKLQYFNVRPIVPEQVKTVELGYRGTLFKKLYIDGGYYHSWYKNFIGFVLGIDATFDNLTNFPSYVQPYRVSANSDDIVTTQGVAIGSNYYFAKKYMLSANYSWNKLDLRNTDDRIIPAFNTPEHKYNLGFSGREIEIPFLKLKNLGFGINYKWIQGFVFEGSPQFTGEVPTYDLLDAQVNYTVPRIHTTFKAGASNVLNNMAFQVYGGPSIGRLAYFSIIYDWNRR
jgi:iron complex outermembrane receptor protein